MGSCCCIIKIIVAVLLAVVVVVALLVFIPRGGKKRALIISITYKGQSSPLPGCYADCQRVYLFLQSMGFAKENITWMADVTQFGGPKRSVSDEMYPSKA